MQTPAEVRRLYLRKIESDLVRYRRLFNEYIYIELSFLVRGNKLFKIEQYYTILLSWRKTEFVLVRQKTVIAALFDGRFDGYEIIEFVVCFAQRNGRHGVKEGSTYRHCLWTSTLL